MVPFIIFSLLTYSDCLDILSCNVGSNNVCLNSQTCEVKCESDCKPLENNEPSICGWLQSLGYNTEHLKITRSRYNLKVESVAQDEKNNIEARNVVTSSTKIGGEVAEEILKGKLYPYTEFRFTEQPLSQKVKLHSKSRLRCSAEGNSSIQYSWRYKASSLGLPELITGASKSTLSFEEVTSQHRGYYICIAKELGSGDTYWSNPALLDVLYMGSSTESDEVKTIASGTSRTTIDCRLPDSNPPALARWYKYDNVGGGRSIVTDLKTTFYNPTSGDLFIINANSIAHDATYHCEAINEDLNIRIAVKNVTVTVTGDQSPRNSPPIIAFFDSKANVGVYVGDPITLRCAAYGHPVPEVYWEFKHQQQSLCKIPHYRYDSYDEGRMIVLKEVMERDIKLKYACMASGNGITTSIGDLSNVGAYKKLDISERKTQYTPKYKGRLNLGCTIIGEGDLVWYKNGQRLNLSGDGYEQNRTTYALDLTITPASHGTYTCLVFSQLGGYMLRNFHVGLPVQNLTATIPLGFMNDVERSMKQITCVVTGFPPPRVYWFENNNLVTDSSRYTISFDVTDPTVINTTLNISNIRNQTQIKCLSIIQTEGYVDYKVQHFITEGSGENVPLVEDNKTVMYIIIGIAVPCVIILTLATFILLIRCRKERRNSKPIRTYIKKVHDLEAEGGEALSDKKDLINDFEFATHLREILKTMKIEDEGGIVSFRDMVSDWMTEDLGGGDSDFARRFRESFASKKSGDKKGGKLFTSNRYGNNFRQDPKKEREYSAIENIRDDENYIPLRSSGGGNSVINPRDSIYNVGLKNSEI